MEEEKKCRTTIERKFYKVSNFTNHFVELDNHMLIDKENVLLAVGDELKVGDIVTNYVVDDCKNLLSVIYKKEFNPNKYPELKEKKITWFKEE